MNIDKPPRFFDYPCPKCGEKTVYWRIIVHLKNHTDGERIRCYNKKCNANFIVKGAEDEPVKSISTENEPIKNVENEPVKEG